MFDLIANPERIQPAYGFYAIFQVAGIVLATLAVLAVRSRWRQRVSLPLFASIWLIGTSILTFLDARDVMQVQELVRTGQYATVEGCLTSFHPGLPYGTKTTAGNERWSVAGQAFDYGQGEVRPGYHLVEARGGLVHANSRVRVAFVVSPYYGRNEIIRLQPLSPICPSAPDTSEE